MMKNRPEATSGEDDKSKEKSHDSSTRTNVDMGMSSNSPARSNRSPSPTPSPRSVPSSVESNARLAAPQVSPANAANVLPAPIPSSAIYRRNSLNFVVGGRTTGNGRIQRRLSTASNASTNTAATTSAKSFPEKLMEMIDAATSGSAEEQNDSIRWLPHGNSFTITDPEKFTKEVLPRNFKKTQYRSFTRKLYRWGFRQITKGPDAGSYFHEHFRRDERTLAQNMNCHYSEKELLLQKESSAARRRASMDGSGLSSVARRRATAPAQRVAARRSSISEVCRPGGEEEDDDAVMRQIEAAAAAMGGEEEDVNIITGSLGGFGDSAASGAVISAASADGGLGNNILPSGRPPKRGSIYSLRSSFSSVGSVLTTQQSSTAAATASALLPLDGDSIPSGGGDLNSTNVPSAIGGLGVPTIIETSSRSNSFVGALDATASAGAIAPGIGAVSDALSSNPLQMANDFRQSNFAAASFLQQPQGAKLPAQAATAGEDSMVDFDLQDPLFGVASQPLQHQSQPPNNNLANLGHRLTPNSAADRNIMRSERIAALTGLQPQMIDAAGGIANLPASVASGLAELNRLQEQIDAIQEAIASGSRQMQMHGLHAASLQQRMLQQRQLPPNTTAEQSQSTTASVAAQQQQQQQQQLHLQMQQQIPLHPAVDLASGDSLSVLNMNQNSANLSSIPPMNMASISSSLDGSLPDFGMGIVPGAANSDGVVSANSVTGTGTGAEEGGAGSGGVDCNFSLNGSGSTLDDALLP